MFLPWLCIFLIIVQFHFRFSIITELHDVSLFLHNFCLAQIPNRPETRPTLSALVCGKNFENLSDAQIYSATGLIHLFVVSGSHLILLQKFLKKIIRLHAQKQFTNLSFIALLLYAAMCLFNPPVTRSLIFLFVSIQLYQRHQYWPKHYLLLLAGLITISLNYQWITSLSLQMSWLAALALEIFSEKFKNFSLIFRQILFYSLFTVCFMGLGFPQFSTIVLCVLLTPILEYILFPFAILTVIFHPLEPLFAGLLRSLNTLLTSLEFTSRSSYLEIPTITFMNWVLIFLCHYLLFMRRPRS